MSAPNILYIHSHDTGRYVQPYGHAIDTPNLQRLAEGGVLFRRAFCAGPTCSPSRAALVTGQSPHSCGMLGLAHRGWSLNDYSRHIIHTLRPAGYVSALAGIQHIDCPADAPDDWSRRIGYDHVLMGVGRNARTGASSAEQAAAEFLRSRPDRPFFLSVGFGQTHRNFPEPDPRDDPRYTQPPAPLPDTPRTRYDMAAFKTHARDLDARMGVVFDALDEARLADNTLVIATTDHGIAFPGMKCNLTDHGIGVMLILRGPGGFTGGKVCDALVSQIDLFPTVCELAGVEAPDRLEGASLLPLARGETDEVNEQVFSEVTYHASYEPQRCVRTDRWKYIRRYGPRTAPVMPNCDDSPSKDVWLEGGWRERPVDVEQLYDLTFDPCETNNLAGDGTHADVLEHMKERLGDWMRRTDDPLLLGPVDTPSGARVNPADGLSPGEPTERVE